HAVIVLPTNFARPTGKILPGARQYCNVSPEVAGRFRQLSHADNTTLFMALLAAYNILLSIYSGQKDIAVGTPVAGRSRRQLEGVIGLFINTLVMRNQVDPQASFRDFLQQIRQTALDAFAHQDVPFEKLVEELHPPRDPSRTPY